jgi:hypothetical protein
MCIPVRLFTTKGRFKLLITFDEFINILFVGAIHSDGRAKRKTHCIYYSTVNSLIYFIRIP